MTPRALVLTGIGATGLALGALLACSSQDAAPPPVTATTTPDASGNDAARVATNSATLAECPPNTMRIDGDPADPTLPDNKGNPITGMVTFDLSGAVPFFASDAGVVTAVSAIVPPPDAGYDASTTLTACSLDTCYGVFFDTKLTGRPLAPGQYDDAQNVSGARYPHAGLSVAGKGKNCGETAGSFTVKSVTLDGGVPTGFSATFVAQCDRSIAEMRGCFRYSR